MEEANRMLQVAKNEQPRRGRPPRGRKTIVQIALDEDVIDYLTKVAERHDGSISAAGREMILEGIAASKKSRR